MLTSLTTIDVIVLLFFVAIMPLTGLLFGKKDTSEDYFLAGRSLRWWMVAGSIFGTNVNSFHLIGMLGIGFSVGWPRATTKSWPRPGRCCCCYVFPARVPQAQGVHAVAVPRIPLRTRRPGSCTRC
jgi:SSS family solute:Na+ symporter